MANEPRNLYDLTSFFRLQVFGIWYNIKEPIGWDNVSIKADRDKEVFGLNYEFVDDDSVTLTFPENEGLEHIRGVYKLQGNDGEITFQYGYIQNNGMKFQFTGTVNLNTYSITEDGVECSIEKLFFEKQLRTRSETKVSFNQEKDFNNNPIIPVQPLNIKLHSKKIIKSAKGVNPVDATSWIAPDWITGSVSYIQPDTSELQTAEVEEMFGMPLAVTGASPISESRFHFLADEAGKANITWKSSFDITVVNGSALENISYVRLFSHIVIRRNNTNILDYSPYVILTQINFNQYNGKGGTGHCEINLAVNADLKRNDEIYFYTTIEANTGANWLKVANVFNYSNSIEVTEQTIAASSMCKGYKILDAANFIVEALTGRKGAVKSKFFGAGGAGEKYILTNGFQIRNFAINEKPVQASWKDIIEGAHPIWCIGVQYSVDATGNSIIILEPVENLFGSKRLLHFNSLWDYKEEHAKDLVYNSAEVGYQKFSEDELNTLDEFNTVAEWLFTINSYKAKYVKKSIFTVSGYSIEKIRREQFKKSPSTSLNQDDDLFIIAYVTARVYNNISFSFSGSFINLDRPTDLQAGQTIRINDGATYTVVNRDYSSPEKFLLSPAPATTGGIGKLEIIILEPEAERNEAFDKVENVISPETSYNLRLTPLQILFNHAAILNSGLHLKLGTDLVKNTSYKNNSKLLLQYNQLEPNKGNYGNAAIQSGAEFTLSEFNNMNKLWMPITCRFKTRIGYNEIIRMKESLTGQLLNDEDNYGVISFIDLAGETWEGVVWTFEYIPSTEICTFTVRKKRKI